MYQTFIEVSNIIQQSCSHVKLNFELHRAGISLLVSCGSTNFKFILKSASCKTA